ncbi:hypothetical protein GCM10027072_05100 [Streptomyces bullii]
MPAEAGLTAGPRAVRAEEAAQGLGRWPRVRMRHAHAVGPARARLRPPHAVAHRTPYFSRSSTFRTFPDTVIGKASRICNLVGTL